MNTVIVTGAAVNGYGQEITKLMLRKGCRVIGTYLTEDESDAKSFLKTLGDEKFSLYPVDIWSRDSLESFVKQVGDTPLYGLVCSQYFWNMENPDDFDFDAWDRSIAANLSAPNFLIRKLIGNIVEGKGGAVVITSTEALTGNYGSTAYSAARAGEHNLVKSLANLYGEKRVRINAIAPGWIGNVMADDATFSPSNKLTPLGRLGAGSEVADVVEWLLSDKSTYVTGATIVCDGGYSNADYMAKYEFEESRKG